MCEEEEYADDVTGDDDSELEIELELFSKDILALMLPNDAVIPACHTKSS